MNRPDTGHSVKWAGNPLPPETPWLVFIVSFAVFSVCIFWMGGLLK